MPGTPHPQSAAVSRRVFLAGTAVALGIAGRELASTFSDSPEEPYPTEAFTTGTTLSTMAVPRGGAPYRRLGYGPGWPRVVREELAPALPGRFDQRTALVAFVQFTDLHITDVQHPLRYEFFRAGWRGAWRPHEALTLPGAVALVERVNALRRGPATGAPLSFTMTTGDNTDNNAKAELEWFLTAMNGGTAAPNTGDPTRYEGVQNSGLALYWHPEGTLGDIDTRAGFPKIDGFLSAAVRTVHSPGLTIPWYSTIGNHDGLSGGCYPAAHNFIADVAVGNRKLEIIPPDVARKIMAGEGDGTDPGGTRIAALLRHERRIRTITPDDRRAPFTLHEYLAAHLDPRFTGPGPAGHGYTQANLSLGTLYYSFSIPGGILGISLDSTDPGGGCAGSVGTAQLRWLEETLTGHRDRYALVFSHHPSWSMTNSTPDPARPGEARHSGAELISTLGRHRNVLAWINGHSHCNRIRPRGTFWEISTASHIDYPHLARIVEVADNHDGTLSLITTLIESAAPPGTYFHDLSQTGLASLYRELAANAPGIDPTIAGTPTDRNTELLLRKA
ncbi:TIGR03767 family metallophosphoesterase [Streptomyces sp. NPDC053048]|uniref:TIGR03767 family metallophosphoesterase n=1 Tax=Streptomyces sp. NPDC053048 TaxID=3365694 RepID=UPI0037D96836